jgi:hypothetical protein
MMTYENKEFRSQKIGSYMGFVHLEMILGWKWFSHSGWQEEAFKISSYRNSNKSGRKTDRAQTYIDAKDSRVLSTWLDLSTSLLKQKHWRELSKS